VGLNIGSKTPPEIAIAILGQMTAVQNGALAALSASAPKQAGAARVGAAAAAESASGAR
jgi:xanthine/CO dehydrogenase XdhC/CoxF family maturation factor